MKKITESEIKAFADYVYQISGIHLDETKGYLLESRLNPLLMAFKLSEYGELLKMAKRDSKKDLQEKIIDAISTNETFFFRDKTPFSVLQYKLIPELIDRRQKLYNSKQIPIRILSAACSTGQEVYSIAMTLKEVIPNINNYDISILGVDIGDEVIARASYGKYGKFEVERGLSPNMLHKYFYRHDQGWRIKDEIRVMANFKKVNLLDTFSNLGYFDIIFCRNVAIYFKYNDKVKLFKKLARILEPDGALIVGGSESLTGVAPDFQVNHYLKGIYYTLKDSSNEKSREVKKFEVHAFNQEQEKPKRVKRIKRTIRYVQPAEMKNDRSVASPQQRFQATQSTLEKLKEKRISMQKKSAELKRPHSNNEEIPEEKIVKQQVTETEVVETPKQEVKTVNSSLQDKINKQYVNKSSLLGTIAGKYENKKTLRFKSNTGSNQNSLLNRISSK